MLNARNLIKTTSGDVIPQYSAAEFGERQKKHRSAIDFFESGQIKSVALEEQMSLETPLGSINCELVTFYEDGSVNRIFPLNGLIDGFWSEANEFDFAEPIDFDLPVGKFSVKVISIHFYPNGQLKSLTIWPGQKLTLETPVGLIVARAGFSLYENGALRSVEPMSAVEVPTSIGLVKAFDPDIIGMHADQNSVQFTKEGTLSSLKTTHTCIQVVGADGAETLIQPYDQESYIDPSQMRTVPMTIQFSEGRVQIEADASYSLPLSEYKFSTFERQRVLRESCVDCPGDETCCENGGDGGGCSGCSGC